MTLEDFNNIPRKNTTQPVPPFTLHIEPATETDYPFGYVTDGTGAVVGGLTLLGPVSFTFYRERQARAFLAALRRDDKLGLRYHNGHLIGYVEHLEDLVPGDWK